MLAVFLCAALLAALPPGGASISGTVVDRATGLPLSGATITSVPSHVQESSDAAGRFTIAVSPGEYRLQAARSGYQPVISDALRVQTGATVTVNLAMQRSDNDLRVIAATTSRGAATTGRSSISYRTLDAERLQRDGTFRAADALRELPGVNNGITGDTGAPADDVNLNIRGLGTLETQATLDGHPIGFGFPGGFNYNLSPLFALRNVEVIYGSGATFLSSTDAIGGIVDFQTLDPTPVSQTSLTQGFGTFQHYATAARATGTDGKLGYATAYGVSHINGVLRDAYIYQPGAAFDQSSTDPTVRGLATYKTDTSAVSRSGLAKVVYAFTPDKTLSLTAVASSMWADKTGNGDGDYLDYGPALTFGQHLLAVKPASDPCGAGTFIATNANGVPNGIRCQTPQQWAAFNAGYQGAGPAWQSFNLQDQDLRFTNERGRSTITADAYVSRFAQTFDRTAQLPFKTVPNDRALWRNRQVVETGASVSDDVRLGKSEFGGGVSWMNDAYSLIQKGQLVGAPVTHETALFLREAYHPPPKLYGYANAWFKNASATRSSYVDSRVSVVYAADTNNSVRYAVGATTAQPTADMLGKQFVESPPGNAGGGASITCSGLNSIGTAPSSLLRPERGVDQELAFAHRFDGDTQVQLSLYNVNVFDKLYSSLLPLSETGAGFVDPSYLAGVRAIVAAKCGAPNVDALLGLTGTFNVGRLRSRGFALDGRWRFNAQTYVDYDWALTSTSILDAPTNLLTSNKTLILGDQLPRVPLHTFSASLDRTLRSGLDVRYTLHTVSVNNTKALPAYDYSDISATYPVKRGSFTVAVANLFNQYADNRGLRYEGVPLPLNGYATAADYAPVTGAASTELFGLPPRSIFFSYTLVR
ncbi:MAG: TonB-dependent receptor [Candidatus Eremiobacteraeota bacterium]|nr:TonB-dependent receptor [Candidatus Eremiobacteraeota bacterium]